MCFCNFLNSTMNKRTHTNDGNQPILPDFAPKENRNETETNPYSRFCTKENRNETETNPYSRFCTEENRNETVTNPCCRFCTEREPKRDGNQPILQILHRKRTETRRKPTHNANFVPFAGGYYVRSCLRRFTWGFSLLLTRYSSKKVSHSPIQRVPDFQRS